MIKAKLTSKKNQTMILACTNKKESDTYEIKYTPCVRGRHQLEITVNGLQVAGSPFLVFVKIHPTQLGKPLKTFPGLAGRGIAFNSKDELVFAEGYSDLVYMDRDGNRLRSIKKSQHGFQDPFGVAVDSSDNVYVTDDECNCVFQIDEYGTKLRAVKPAIKKLDLRGIAVSGDQVIVADYANRQLLSFTRDLEFRKKDNLHGSRPTGVACDLDGNICV